MTQRNPSQENTFYSVFGGAFFLAATLYKFGASRRGKNGLKSSRRKNERHEPLKCNDRLVNIMNIHMVSHLRK